MSDRWRDRCAALPFVSRETLLRLDALVDHLGRWNRAINLVAASTLREAWRRHVLDSLQLWPLAPEEARTWVDIGSGGGFPGLVVAAVAAQQAPSLKVTLVEADARKAAFLIDAARRLEVSPEIRIARAEADPFQADVVSARAVAPLPKLVPLIRPWMAERGVALLLKGEGVADELTAAHTTWHTHSRIVESVSDPKGVVLVMSEISRV